jgi:hypothetical protein
MLRDASADEENAARNSWSSSGFSPPLGRRRPGVGSDGGVPGQART